jgi:hypothetical protein
MSSVVPGITNKPDYFQVTWEIHKEKEKPASHPARFSSS